MRVWLVTVGEPLPVDGTDARLYRAGMLAKFLAAAGHEVIWWTSDFDHVAKKARYGKNTVVQMDPNYRLHLMHSVDYYSNVSLRRLANHYQMAKIFRKWSSKEERPDIILCSMPTIELSLEAAKIGIERDFPVVLDIRDLWPDLFLELFPAGTQGVAKLLLHPYFRAIRSACSKATAIIGLTDAFVDWGVNYAGRQRGEFDRVFPLGYTAKTPRVDALAEAEVFWKNVGISDDKKEFIICFFGTLGRQFDIETVIQAARILERTQNRPFRFVLCGSGDRFCHYQQLAAECRIVDLPGWIDAPKIWALMRMSRVGIAPYNNTSNFMMNLPNKPIEYLSAGLPIVTSLQGVLQRLLTENECGLNYTGGSPEELVRILVDLRDKPSKVDKMATNALKLYQRDFVAEQVYGNLISYLEVLAGAKN